MSIIRLEDLHDPQDSLLDSVAQLLESQAFGGSAPPANGNSNSNGNSKGIINGNENATINNPDSLTSNDTLDSHIKDSFYQGPNQPLNPDFNLHQALVDFPYYAQHLLWIKNKNADLVPFELWEPQRKLHTALQRQVAKGGQQRAVVLKARQEGISTYCEGRIFHNAHLNENTKNIIIAHEKESGSGIFGMCRLFYDCLPKPLKPMTRYSSKRELVFENPDEKTRSLNPGLRSSLEVLTAGKKSVARGITIHTIHASELASWTFPEDVIPALLPTVPKTPNSLIIYESTAKGVGNFFHKEWLRAINGESNFLPFFLSWFDLSSYSMPFPGPDERKAFHLRLNEEEKELMAIHRLTLEQLYWRRITIADLGGDVELFRQEYPSTAEEAFIVSGIPVFDRHKLRMMALKCTPPNKRYEADQSGLMPNDQGRLRLWDFPRKGSTYCLGVDVADGGPQGDYSCIEVWRLLESPYFAEQVAEWHGHIDPYNFAHIIERIATLYNEALVAIETNAHGLATQQELQRSYWNLYQQSYMDRYKNTLQNKLGWETTVRSKKLLIAFGSHCVADMTIIIHSADLIQEAMTFVRDDMDGAAAASNGHDDRIMAALIGLFALHMSTSEDGLEDMVGSIASPINRSHARKPESGPNYIDVEFAAIMEYGLQDNYQQTWMNL